jgi:CheY-like chemotaxis protein
MSNRMKAVAFDLDDASMISLREALPDWEIEVLHRATATSLAHDWNGEANLLILVAREEVTETLRMCRFLVHGEVFSTDSRPEELKTLEVKGSRGKPARQANAPLLLLVSAGQKSQVRAALEAGANSCLILPVHAKEMASVLARVRHDNQPGRHTLNLDPAQIEDRWRDDGGEA